MIIFLYIILTLIVLMSYFYIADRIKKRNQTNDFFNSFKSENFKLPELKFGSAHGHDSFYVVFENANDLDLATKKGLIENFEQKISNYYGSYFDPKLAISYNYKNQNGS